MSKLQDGPVIGVTMKHGDAEWQSKYAKNYVEALAELGAVGIVLSPDAPTVLPDGTTFHPDSRGRLSSDVLEYLDGLVLSGGGDVDPKFFGETLNGANVKTISIPRDELELDITRQALSTDLPIFGICRGCQVLNVAAGGGMVQHFDGHRSPRENPFYHDVLIDPESQLYGIVEKQSLPTNTYHHQGVDHETLASMFTATGIVESDPWLIEAFESPKHTWVIGLQWHPERLYELSDDHHKIWSDFVETCRQRAQSAKLEKV